MSNPESIIYETALSSTMNGDMILAKEFVSMTSSSSSSEHSGIIEAKRLGLIPNTYVLFRYLDRDGNFRKGKVTRFRENVGGLYCGIRYPIEINLFEENQSFEYSLDDVIVFSDYGLLECVSKEHREVFLESLINPDIQIYVIYENGNDEYTTGINFLDSYNTNNLYEISK